MLDSDNDSNTIKKRSGSLVLGGGGSGGSAARPAPAPGEPIYNTLLRKAVIKRKRRSTGKLYSRSLIGMLIPGKYLFITYSSIGGCPYIGDSWPQLRKWLKRNYPGWEWLYCLTDEHLGVVHMIVRLGEGESLPDVEYMRAYWLELHRSPWVRIVEVTNACGLANYISDQRRRKGMAVEMSSQETIIRWRMGEGWVPRGFMAAFGRFYYRYGKVLDDLTIKELVRDWIIDCRKDAERVRYPPWVKGNVCHWSNESMSKPVVRLFMGGSVKFVSPGDTYKDPSGNEKTYDKAKVMVSLAGAKQAWEISKFALDAIRDNLKDPVIQEKMKEWTNETM